MSPDKIQVTPLHWADRTSRRNLRQAQEPGDPVSVGEYGGGVLIDMASVYRTRLSAVLTRDGRLGASWTEPWYTYQPDQKSNVRIFPSSFQR